MEDTEKVRQQVKALTALSKEFRLSREIQVDATELQIRAEKRLGEMLRKMEKNPGVLKEGDSFPQSHGVTTGISTLSDLGITKNESSKFQKLAAIDEPDFEKAVTDLKQEAIAGRQSALSTAGVIRVTREEGREDKEPEFSSLIKPSDNWNFGTIKYGRIDDGVEEDWGYIPGKLYANCRSTQQPF